MFHYKKDKILIHSFNNISDFYNYIKKTPKRPSANDASESGDYYFTKTKNLEEAYNLLLNGDEIAFNKFKALDKISVNKLLGNVINKPKQKNDIVGFQANVPQYLLGLPTNMINQEPKKLSQKVLNIIINITVSGGVSSSKIEKVGNLYIQILDLLEKAGYRVNLYVINAESSYGYLIFCLIRIKTDREPFNIKKCIFPLSHPSMERRIFFKWDEVCDTETEFTHDGYGRPYTDNKNIKDIFDKVLKANFIIWNFQRFKEDNSIDVEAERILKELKENYGIDVSGKEK